MGFSVNSTKDTGSAMILIIAEPTDRAALWLHAALRKASQTPVGFVTPSQLSYAPVAAHRMSTDTASVSFVLANGETICGHQLAGVINRVLFMPQGHLLRADAIERTYAQGELYAFALGWMSALPCPILNPPTPDGLCGAAHSEVTTLHYAVLSGLMCTPLRLTASHEATATETDAITQCHVVFDGQVFGRVISSSDQNMLRQFAHLWGGRIVQIHTYVHQNKRFFASATSLVDFPSAGNALVLSIARALQL